MTGTNHYLLEGFVERFELTGQSIGIVQLKVHQIAGPVKLTPCKNSFMEQAFALLGLENNHTTSAYLRPLLGKTVFGSITKKPNLGPIFLINTGN